MKEPKNPFRLRAAEHIETETTFLHLFGPGVLELLPKSDSWNRVQIFQSAPGGGKTSLFRVFTPQCLLALYAARTKEDLKDLYHRMRDLAVISDKGVHLLGVTLSCARNYAALEDLNLEAGRKERLLYALLNARIILSTLRAALSLKKLEYPKDLYRLQITSQNSIDLPTQFPVPCFRSRNVRLGSICREKCM